MRDGPDEDYAVNYLTNRYNATGDYDIKAEYDAAGNVTTDPNLFEYEYDYENRLLGIYWDDQGEDELATFTYDALGRRIQKYFAANEITTTYYYNNNWQVLTEIEDDGVDVVERDFVYGNYIDEVLMMVIDDPNTYYYAHDHLYSPVALIDDEGVVQERYEYDAYGKPNIMDADFDLLPVQKSDYGNPYYFTGRRVDFLEEHLCLQYSRNRYYDYYTGRWLTQDKAGYGDGLNLYEYVKSNSLLFKDPFGLFCGDCSPPEEDRDNAYHIRILDVGLTSGTGMAPWDQEFTARFIHAVELAQLFVEINRFAVNPRSLAAAVDMFYIGAYKIPMTELIFEQAFELQDVIIEGRGGQLWIQYEYSACVPCRTFWGAKDYELRTVVETDMCARPVGKMWERDYYVELWYCVHWIYHNPQNPRENSEYTIVDKKL